MLNLQSNALKFTTKGEIKINVHILERLQADDYKGLVIDENKENLFLKISVEDTGVGIKVEDQNKLFKLFGYLKES